MKGNPEVIQALSEVLTGELTAISQYFTHARMCDSWGYKRIGETIYKESIDEMKHARDVMDRILFLEGIPNLQKLGKLSIGEDIPEQLKADLKLEYEAVEILRRGIEVCRKAQDHTSKELLERILEDEERHIDWIESQLGIIRDIGKENYLAQQIHS